MSSDRRFLTFPAIHPCSAVSPAALLADISSLAADIQASGSPQSDHFRTHRRAAREAVRFASVIISFLDELCFPATLPSAAILSLSDLHVTLQKLRLLLSDCARGGARLWILMNAARVAGEFHALLRSFGPALEVLPVDSMDVSDEIRELLRLLAGQARRVDAGVEVVDDRAARSVRSMFAQFESGESPDADDLRRVLNHLNIKSWCDCLEEVGFLEEQIFADEENGDSALLWSAMGLMIYSMVVVFDSTTSGNKKKMDGFFFLRRESTVAVKHLPSDEFRCPISLELMKDPVTVSTGQTYDRPSILRWMKSGNQTCPITGEKLSSSVLIPNSVVRKLVGVYCHENGISISQKRKTSKRDLSKTLSPAAPAAVAAIRMASTVIVGKLAAESPEKKSIAAYIIRMLTKSNNFNRICFVEAGAIPLLLNLLSSSDPSLQENAAASLLNLSKHHSGRTDIFESAGLAPVVETMKIGHKVESRQNAAAILFYLAAIEDCRRAIGDMPEAIQGLVELLGNGTYRGKKNAVLTIYALLLFSGNQAKILAADTVAAISKLIETEEEDLVTDCVGLLAKIAERDDGADVILKSGYVVDQLVNVLRISSSPSGREYCASALLSLCNNGGEKAMIMLEKMPLLIPSLYSLLSDGSRQASKKARSLLNCMHQFADQAYAQRRPPPPADPMIHVL
ncbi:U-box domain-containing protein 19 [Platanthera zijinensis]|uniref:RING-type E3 ubiquitin transferase n=1 Tax=Platanthera zijinensis TaxID=2320716 RepID=A0AAP0B4J7_9ASPA